MSTDVTPSLRRLLPHYPRLLALFCTWLAAVGLVWCWELLQPMATLPASEVSLYFCSAAFSPNDQWLAAAKPAIPPKGQVSPRARGPIRLWDWRAGQPVAEFDAEATGIYVCAFSHGQELLVLDNRGWVLFDLADGKERWRLPSNIHYQAQFLFFTPDQQSVFLLCYDQEASEADYVQVDLRTGRVLRRFARARHAAALSPDGRYFACTDTQSLRSNYYRQHVAVHDLETGRAVHCNDMERHVDDRQGVVHLRFVPSREGCLLWVQGLNKETPFARLYEPRTGKLVREAAPATEWSYTVMQETHLRIRRFPAEDTAFESFDPLTDTVMPGPTATCLRGIEDIWHLQPLPEDRLLLHAFGFNWQAPVWREWLAWLKLGPVPRRPGRLLRMIRYPSQEVLWERTADEFKVSRSGQLIATSSTFSQPGESQINIWKIPAEPNWPRIILIAAAAPLLLAAAYLVLKRCFTLVAFAPGQGRV